MKPSNKIDIINKNNLWRDAIEKEMTKVGVASKVLEDVNLALIGWKNVIGHLVCYVNMDFNLKERWFLDGHNNTNPIGSTYDGVLSR